MEKINEECKLAGNIQPFMFFQYKSVPKTNISKVLGKLRMLA